MGIFTKGINKGAYRGELTCPVCRSSAIRFVENIGPTRQRYRCRKCGLTFQYDISGRLDHPYAPYKKNTFREIVERYNVTKGRTT